MSNWRRVVPVVAVGSRLLVVVALEMNSQGQGVRELGLLGIVA